MELRDGYKKTEIGVIPEDWDCSNWSDVFGGFTSGATPYRAIKSYYNGNIRWITSGELNYSVIYDTIEHISEEARVKTNLKIHPVGTFLMAITGLEAEGTRGSCAVVGNPSTTNQSCMAIYGTEQVLVDYLFYYYCMHGNELALKYCQGTKQQSYTAKIAKLLPIIYPKSIKEQQAIATALSDIDGLISSLAKLIDKKKNIKQGAMQELLTGRKRLDGFSGEWEVRTLGDLFGFNGGHSASREQLSLEGYCYLHYGDIHGSNKTFIDVDKEYMEIPKLDISLRKISKVKLLQDGDVVFVDASEDDEGTSKHIVVQNPNNIPFISGLHTIVSKSKNEYLDKKFKQYCFQSSEIKSQFKFYAVGTKVSGISRSTIAKINLRFPASKEEQAAIANILSDMDKEIETLGQKLNKYKEIKQGMMQELLSGRIRLFGEVV